MNWLSKMVGIQTTHEIARSARLIRFGFAARVTPLDPPPICELVPEQSSDM